MALANAALFLTHTYVNVHVYVYKGECKLGKEVVIVGRLLLLMTKEVPDAFASPVVRG